MTNRVKKTTARHFAVFKEEGNRLATLWGLNDIKLYYHHGKRDSRATFSGSDTKRVGTLTLSTHWEARDPTAAKEPVSDDEIRLVARHEIIHALILPVVCLIATHTTQDEAERAEEALVQRLMRILPGSNQERK